MREVSSYGVISGPYFLVFRLNTEIYYVNPYIQSEYRKIRTRKKTRIRTLFTQCKQKLSGSKLPVCCLSSIVARNHLFFFFCFYQIINNDIIFNMADTKIKCNRPIPFSIVLVPNYCKWLTCLEPVLCSVWNIFCLLACLLSLPLMETEHLAVCLQTCHVL